MVLHISRFTSLSSSRLSLFPTPQSTDTALDCRMNNEVCTLQRAEEMPDAASRAHSATLRLMYSVFMLHRLPQVRSAFCSLARSRCNEPED